MRNLLGTPGRNAGPISPFVSTTIQFGVYILLAGKCYDPISSFNPVFFTSSPTNQYAVAVVSQALLENDIWEPTKENTNPRMFSSATEGDLLDESMFKTDDGDAIISIVRDTQVNPQNLVGMDGFECIKHYALGFFETNSNVTVVSATQSGSNPILWTRYLQRSVLLDNEDTSSDPSHWICHDLSLNPEHEPDRICFLLFDLFSRFPDYCGGVSRAIF